MKPEVMTFEAQLESYASLIVTLGLGIQSGQRLLIQTEIAAAPFAQRVARRAYQQGARLVSIYYEDDTLRKTRFELAPKDSFADFYDWQAAPMLEVAQKHDAVLGLFATDPELLRGFDVSRVTLEQNTLNEKLIPFWEKLGKRFPWCAAAAATPAWAERIFPGQSDALEKLWQAIFTATMITTQQPESSWQTMLQTLEQRSAHLNARRYHGLHFFGAGTDLEVGLADAHIWVGGQDMTHDGLKFVANLPGFEVCTAPHRERVNGTVRGSKPTVAHGTLIEDWSLEFSNGRVVRAEAKRGLEALEAYLEMDDQATTGTKFLGEVALVESGSPVEQSKVLFKRALLDENAASHIALGFAYRHTIEGGEAMSREEFEGCGGNTSLEHKDLMLGSEATDVDGIYADGRREAVMRQGKFVMGD